MLWYFRRLILLALTLAILPVLALLALVLGIALFIDRVIRLTRPAAPRDSAPLSGMASIVVLNWNGRDLLEQGMPSVMAAVRADGRNHEIIVVDNGSTDDSVEYLRREFPQVRIIALEENQGFARGNNAGVRAARHDIVILLNNDMVVEPGFLRPLIDGFGSDTFAVSSQIFLQDPAARREETGMTTAVFRRGMIDFTHREVESAAARPYYPALWAGGGSSAFHRKRFLSLGGFSEVFLPAYVEDTDLSYQAWKAGWEILFAPGSVVHHRHRASSARRFSPLQLQALVQRNQLLFTWKNISGWRFLLSHALFLPWNCYRLARDAGLPVSKGVLAAVVKLPAVIAARICAPYRHVRSDRDIFRMFASPGLFFAARAAIARKPRTPAASAGLSDGRPRVLWLTAYLPHLGRHAGAGRMYHLLQRLAARYRITLLSFLESDDEREFLPEVEALCDDVIAMRRQAPFRWNLFPYEPFDEFLTPQMERALHDRLEQKDFDLIQLEYTQMACYARRELGIPTLLTKHEVDFAACARRARLEDSLLGKLRWFYNYLQVLDRETSLLKRVDAAICMTDTDRSELRKFCRSIPVHVINTGVDLEYFSPPESLPDSDRLVFVGAFQHQPNIDAMLYFCKRILPLIRSQAPSVKLGIVGSKPPQAIAQLASIPGVQVTGFVPDIRPHMASSAVYVVPLRLGVGIRGKILEAWGMAMPVVATPVGAAGLRVQDGQNMLIADTPELFAEHVLSLLANPGLREQLGRNARTVAEKFYGWDAAAAKLDRLYQSLMHNGEAENPASV